MFSLIRRRTPRGTTPDKDARGRRGISVASIWRYLLPAAIAAISGSILVSGGDPDQRPYLIFGAGALAGVIGLISLFISLVEQGNAERARRRARDAARAARTMPPANGPVSKP